MLLYGCRHLLSHKQEGIEIPVVMGGILNQKIESQALPKDVSVDLKKLNFYPCPKLDGNFRKLLDSNIKFSLDRLERERTKT